MTIDPSILTQAADSALRRYRLGDWSRVKDPGVIRNDIIVFACWNAWDRILSKMDAYGPGGKVCNAEAAVAACMRKGLKREDIMLAGETLILRLTYGSYRITKQLSGFSARISFARPCGHLPAVLFMEPEAFADFLFAFDSIIPALREIVDERVMPKVNKLRMKWEKEELVRSMISLQVDALVHENLDPLGISCAYGVEKEQVSMTLIRESHRMMASLTVPFDKLAETLRDTDGILSKLTPAEGVFPGDGIIGPDMGQVILSLKSGTV